MAVSDSSIPMTALLFSSSSLNVHWLYPGGGSLRLNAIIFASMPPVTFAGTGGVSRFFRFSARSSPSSAYCLPAVYIVLLLVKY
jgi:hypothetical protein